RARGSGRRGPRLRRRPPRPVRRRRRLRPRRPAPVACGPDAADPERDQQPARRHRRPPVRPDDPDARRPRPRLGGGLRRGRADGDRPRDERLAPSPRPLGRARSARGRGRLRPDDRLGRPQHPRARLHPLGRHPGAAGLGELVERRQYAFAGGPARVGSREARSDRRLTGATAGPATADPERLRSARMTPPPSRSEPLPARRRLVRSGLERTVRYLPRPATGLAADGDVGRGRRDLEIVVAVVVVMGTVVSGPLVWAVAVLLLAATVVGTLQVLAEVDSPHAERGVPVESLVVPAVAALGAVGAIRLVPLGPGVVVAI